MASTINSLNQPVGEPMPDWRGARRPDGRTLEGRYCCLEVLDPVRHAEDLYAAFSEDRTGELWTYMVDGPYSSFDTFLAAVEKAGTARGFLYYAVLEKSTGLALGRAAYLRVDPVMGNMEVGSIAYSPRLQRTNMATEAVYLMLRHAFDDLGYRRCEWKCDSLNAASRRAAVRLGFSYEGLFRQAMVYKGRNRDTAWYAMVDGDWPGIRQGVERWLEPENFDRLGRQKQPLRSLLDPAP